MKKFAGNLITFLCALGILWILVSWADVIAHNTTYQQKEQYMKNNAFVVLEYLKQENEFCVPNFGTQNIQKRGEMRSYKEYEKKYIGMSDIANLILAGSSDNGLRLTALHFGMDNDYYAYIVDSDAEIGEHYTKVAEFRLVKNI